MIGYFNVVDKRTKEVILYYKYSSINDVQKQLIRNNPSVELICACNDKKLEMKISSDLRIYPAEQMVGHLHDARCPKHINFVPEKLWTIQKTETNIYYNVASHDATAKDYFEKINLLTHRRLTYPEYRLPDNYKDFNKRAFVTTKYIKAPTGDVLYDIAVSNNRNIKEWPTFKEFFIYGEVVGISKTEFNNDIYYVDVMDSFEHRYRFYIDKAVLATLINPATFDRNAKYIGGGFAYKKKENQTILSFADFYIAKIDKIGLIAGLKEKQIEK